MTSYENSQQQSIHVLVANLPEIWGQLIAQRLDMEPDIVLTDFVDGNLETLVAAHDHVDVVILGAQHAVFLPGIGSHLLTEFPHLRIMVLVISSDRVAGYWLGLKRQEMVLKSISDLAPSIREFYRLDPLAE